MSKWKVTTSHQRSILKIQFRPITSYFLPNISILSRDTVPLFAHLLYVSMFRWKHEAAVADPGGVGQVHPCLQAGRLYQKTKHTLKGAVSRERIQIFWQIWIILGLFWLLNFKDEPLMSFLSSLPLSKRLRWNILREIIFIEVLCRISGGPPCFLTAASLQQSHLANDLGYTDFVATVDGKIWSGITGQWKSLTQRLTNSLCSN